MVGQARLELALSERTGFTVRCGTNYALLTHIYGKDFAYYSGVPLFWELTAENTQISIAFFGGTGWLRSSDAQDFNLPLYQLSYGSIGGSGGTRTLKRLPAAVFWTGALPITLHFRIWGR